MKTTLIALLFLALSIAGGQTPGQLLNHSQDWENYCNQVKRDSARAERNRAYDKERAQVEQGLDNPLGNRWGKVKYDSIAQSQTEKYFLGIILNAYSRYEKECWADTTWITQRAFAWLSQSLSAYEIYRSDEVLFYLRRAPTFPGFIEFLRKQK